jgi:type II secretory pathway component PulF
LYADCEGLEGGEEKPVANALATLARKTVLKASQKLLDNVENQVQLGNQYPMAWAHDKDKSKREYSVLHLYPRLLFTFSDVVVFVLKNQRLVM